MHLALALKSEIQINSYQSIWPELEINQEDVPVDCPAAEIVDVEVLHYLPQVGVEDVGEEGVEHLLCTDTRDTYNVILTPVSPHHMTLSTPGPGNV